MNTNQTPNKAGQSVVVSKPGYYGMRFEFGTVTKANGNGFTVELESGRTVDFTKKGTERRVEVMVRRAWVLNDARAEYEAENAAFEQRRLGQ